jgi:hypothetical protein
VTIARFNFTSLGICRTQVFVARGSEGEHRSSTARGK